MNKKELIKKIATETNSTLKATGEFIDAFCNAVTDALVEGDKVQLVGFGTFEVRHREARVGRNPRTGETVEIKPSKAPSFKAGGTFKSAIKNS